HAETMPVAGPSVKNGTVAPWGFWDRTDRGSAMGASNPFTKGDSHSMTLPRCRSCTVAGPIHGPSNCSPGGMCTSARDSSLIHTALSVRTSQRYMTSTQQDGGSAGPHSLGLADRQYEGGVGKN